MSWRVVFLLCALLLLGTAQPAHALDGQVEALMMSSRSVIQPGETATLTLSITNPWPDAEPLAAQVTTPPEFEITAGSATSGTVVFGAANGIEPTRAVWSGVVDADMPVTIWLNVRARTDAEARGQLETFVALASTNWATGLITPEVRAETRMRLGHVQPRYHRWLPIVRR